MKARQNTAQVTGCDQLLKRIGGEIYGKPGAGAKCSIAEGSEGIAARTGGGGKINKAGSGCEARHGASGPKEDFGGAAGELGEGTGRTEEGGL